MSHSKPAFLRPTFFLDCLFLLWYHLPFSFQPRIPGVIFNSFSLLPDLIILFPLAIILSFSSLTFQFLGVSSNSLLEARNRLLTNLPSIFLPLSHLYWSGLTLGYASVTNKKKVLGAYLWFMLHGHHRL